jgi:glycosyltransferase involved in cell wall biosynthesis
VTGGSYTRAGCYERYATVKRFVLVLNITHVVRSDAFAGVERYVCGVANTAADRGQSVSVIGGDPQRMVAELDPRVVHVPAATVLDATRALVKHSNTDLVHVHMTAAECAAILSRPWHRAPIVATRHFPDPRGNRILGKALAPIIGGVLSQQVAISRFVAAAVSEASVLIYNGVPARAQAPLVSRRVLMMQRLEREKASDVGIRAWAHSGLPAQGWLMEVAGSGTQEEGLRRLCLDLQVSTSVRFVGTVRDTDSLLQNTSVLLAPAPREPFGFAVVEAMAHGIPVVAAAGGGHLETLGSGGFLFPPGKPSHAAHSLRLLADSQRLRHETGSRLQDRQRRLFSLDVHVDRLEQVYASVV